MSKDATLICLEVNNDFVSKLNQFPDERLQVYNACAANLHSIIHSLDMECVDYVVSSLPLALIADDTVDSILENVSNSLCPQGRFLQYQYSLAHYGNLKKLFKHVKLRFTLRNMPPAFIYECSN